MLPLNILKTNLLYFYWLFFTPIVECFLSATRCDDDGFSIVEPELKCYSGPHIFYVVLSMIMLVLAVIIALWVSILYQKTEPSETDALAQYFYNILILLIDWKIL